ncbi:hypothetical protein CYMTET_41543 [Cymbomonas tetramitiformis]|uniref:VWFA domain-containing protein n=1 Tax=Cymbomonas tetramitiformis TaxID=36881 RepID=A0AAE0C7V0_9CHLO|nr:hypothetical protein CYMTET_41543 [Cymbomonas tetramitiformis]
MDRRERPASGRAGRGERLASGRAGRASSPPRRGSPMHGPSHTRSFTGRPGSVEKANGVISPSGGSGAPSGRPLRPMSAVRRTSSPQRRSSMLRLPALDSSKDPGDNESALLSPRQAVQRERFGRVLGPDRTPGSQAVLQKTDGIPRLQHILLPWFYFTHAQGEVPILGNKMVASVYCQGLFLEYYMKDYPRKGVTSPMHGVYEGSYFDLLQDLEMLLKPLRKLALHAPLEKPIPEYTVPELATLPSLGTPYLEKLEEKPVQPKEDGRFLCPEPKMRAVEFKFVPPDDRHLPKRPEQDSLPIYNIPSLLPLETAFTPPEISLPSELDLPMAPKKPERPGEAPVMDEVKPFIPQEVLDDEPWAVSEKVRKMRPPERPTAQMKDAPSVFEWTVEPELQVQPLYFGANVSAGECTVYLQFRPPFMRIPYFVPPAPPKQPEHVLEELTPLPPWTEPPFQVDEDVAFVEPELNPLPTYVAPTDLIELPRFTAPNAPPPVGYLPGLRPLIILDMSGTMHGSQETVMRRVVRELLDPIGELAGSALYFEVLMFNRNARMFGVEQIAKSERRQEVERALHQPFPKGQRPVGGNRPSSAVHSTRPMSANPNSRNLVRCSPEAIELAHAWTEQAPCVGPTNMESAFEAAVKYTKADCVYLVTDGRADRVSAVQQLVESLVESEQWRMPIHAIGVECNIPGRRLLEQLAATTKGSFTPYVWDGLKAAPEADAATRFIERTLRKLRAQNMASGVLEEPLSVSLERTEKLFQIHFVQPLFLKNEELVHAAKMEHAGDCQEVVEANHELMRVAKSRHEERVSKATALREARVAAAKEEYEAQLQEIDKENRVKADKRAVALFIVSKKEEELLKFAAEAEKQRALWEEREAPAVKLTNAAEMTKFESEYKKHCLSVRVYNERVKENLANFEKSLALFQSELESAIAEDFLMFHIKSCKRKAVLELENEEAEAEYKDEEMAINKKNRNAQVAYKMAVRKWEEYVEKNTQWQEQVDRLVVQRERAMKAAQEDYPRVVAAAEKEWHLVQEQHKKQNERLLQLSQEEHAKHVAIVERHNKMRMDEWDAETSEWRRLYNKMKAQYHWKVASLKFEARRDYRILHLEWLAMMMQQKLRAQRQYEQMLRLWEDSTSKAKAVNEERILEVKQKHQQQCDEIRRRNAQETDAAMEDHRVAMAEALEWNESIKPVVEKAKLAKVELMYVEAFMKQIKLLAGENLDRVVEMSSITSSLENAIPGGIPWPIPTVDIHGNYVEQSDHHHVHPSNVSPRRLADKFGAPDTSPERPSANKSSPRRARPQSALPGERREWNQHPKQENIGEPVGWRDRSQREDMQHKQLLHRKPGLSARSSQPNFGRKKIRGSQERSRLFKHATP